MGINFSKAIFVFVIFFMINNPYRAKGDETVYVIPKPAVMEVSGGSFTLNPNTGIFINSASKEVMAIGNYLADKLNVPTGYSLRVKRAAMEEIPENSILLATSAEDKSSGEEGYELSVTEKSIVLRASNPCGLFRGVQTIRQLLPLEIESDCLVQKEIEWTIPCLKIEDTPRYGWRGLMLDCSRTFLTKEYIMRYIDLLAYYKMNRLHLHLVDDQGWRLEIRKYPNITETGAWAIKSDGVKVGGFYTQDEIKEIVAYAKARYIMVIPEIEMPGHSVEVVASYPEFSCRPGPFQVLTLPVTALYRDGALCAGNEATFEFLEGVLSEVINLFPAPFIHIGGDECVKDNWKECRKCQDRIRKEGLKDEDELQSYFIKRIETYLNANNRRLIGWDEILEGGLAPNAAVMFWRAFKGIDGALEPANAGHDIVMSPTSHSYLDYTHEKISLRKAYSYEPTPPGLSPEREKHILGVQGNMWTHIATLEPQIDAQIFPRLIALAEVGWSQKNVRNWEEFSRRIKSHYSRLDIMGVNYTLDK